MIAVSKRFTNDLANQINVGIDLFTHELQCLNGVERFRTRSLNFDNEIQDARRILSRGSSYEPDGSRYTKSMM